MTQDQGTKLEGMFTSGLQHWSSMDDQLENVVEKMNVAESHLARIAENTGMSVTHLNDIKEEIRKIIRDDYLSFSLCRYVSHFRHLPVQHHNLPSLLLIQ